MSELLRNAWMGWFRLTGDGKIMALFLAALLSLWINREREKQRQFLHYSTVSAVCCILPVTAAVLSLYQTRFYDYEWIWSIVPVTVVTAYAGTKVLAEHWQGFRREAWRKGLPVTAGLLAAAFLCANFNSAAIDRENERAGRAEAECILETVRAEGIPETVGDGTTVTESGSICMWAPEKVMGYARRLDSSILLPYGRNMWEEALGAYSYDTCSAEIKDMYQWMCIVEETCTENDFDLTDIVIERMEEQELSTEKCLDTAREAGVTLLILPENTNQLLLDEVISAVGIQPEQSSGYYFFHM